MKNKKVTEADFRMPEFRSADPEDYEFRSDGALVRKDRWERGMRSIAYEVTGNSRKGFEISEIVQVISWLLSKQSISAPDDGGDAEESNCIENSVNQFAKFMNDRMQLKLQEGYKGWREPSKHAVMTSLVIKAKAVSSKGGDLVVRSDDLLDIANFAMMLFMEQWR